MTLTLPHHEAKELECDDVFAHVFLRIRTKDMEIVPFLYNAMQRHYDIRRTPRDLILKARQLGFSTKIQGEEARATMFNTASSLTIADTMDNTRKLRMIYNRFYEKWPEQYLPLRPPRAQDSAVTVTYPHTDSESWIMTAGSKSAGKAATYSHIHFSELAFYPDATSVFGSTLQAATPEARVVIESTPNGAQGLFYDLCMRALDGDTAWRLHFYPWWWAKEYRTPLDVGEELRYTEDEVALIHYAADSGFHLTPEQIKWRRGKQEDLPHTFLQEYPEDPKTCFLLSGGSYFGDLSGKFTAEFLDHPLTGHVCDAGIDWGQAQDWTVVSIIDRHTRQQVAILRMRRLPWKVMRTRILDALYFWGVRNCMIEINSIGGVNFEVLQDEVAKRNEGREDFPGLQLIPFTTGRYTKPAMVQSLYQALHNGPLRLLSVEKGQPSEQQQREFQAFQATQNPQTMEWKYEAAAGEHDDCVIATGLSWLASIQPEIGEITVLE